MRLACLGKYDALHRGHAANIAAAQQAGGKPVLVTFSGMAKAFGWEPRPPWCATTERALVLEQWGADELVLPFDEVRDLSMEAFYACCAITTICRVLRGR